MGKILLIRLISDTIFFSYEMKLVIASRSLNEKIFFSPGICDMLHFTQPQHVQIFWRRWTGYFRVAWKISTPKCHWKHSGFYQTMAPERGLFDNGESNLCCKLVECWWTGLNVFNISWVNAKKCSKAFRIKRRSLLFQTLSY